MIVDELIFFDFNSKAAEYLSNSGEQTTELIISVLYAVSNIMAGTFEQVKKTVEHDALMTALMEHALRNPTAKIRHEALIALSNAMHASSAATKLRLLELGLVAVLLQELSRR